MNALVFKQKIKEEAEKIGYKKFKNSFFKEGEDSMIFMIPRKSGYSNKYYLRIKTQLKPLGPDFVKDKYIKHDVSDILLSLDCEDPETFDLDNNMEDSVRLEKLEFFFLNNVSGWTRILFEKNRIIEKYHEKELFLTPFIKNKIGLTK
jgi:hypothetical protein